MKIAIVAPPFGDTGGPEVATSNLVNALVDKGIDVTYFAPKDFKTKAKHVHTLYKSIWNMPDFQSQTRIVRRNYIIASQTKVLSAVDGFDLIHLNTQKYAYCVGAGSNIPCLVTFHNKITTPEFLQIKKGGIYTVAQSAKQSNGSKTTAAISNGIDTKFIKPSFEKGKYLITVGRIKDQKGVETAIKIAEKANKKLLIIGRVGIADERRAYFNNKIRPHLNKNITHMDEVPQKVLFKYIREAEALLIPIKKESGHLLVCPLLIMESLACGTPVIGTLIKPAPVPLRSKSVATLSNDLNVLIEAAKNTDKFDRHKCREFAEKYFDSSIMAEKYIKLYKKIIEKPNN